MSKIKEQLAKELQDYIDAVHSGAWAKLKATVGVVFADRSTYGRGKLVADLLKKLNEHEGDEEEIEREFQGEFEQFRMNIKVANDTASDDDPLSAVIRTDNSAALQIMFDNIYALLPEWAPKADSAKEEGKVHAVSPVTAAVPVPAPPSRPAPPVPAAAPLVAAAVAPVPQRMDPPRHSPVVAAAPKPAPKWGSRSRDTSDRVLTRAMVKQQAQRDAARMMTVDQFCAGGKAAAQPAASAVEKAGMFARNAAAQRAEARVAQLRHEARRDATSPTEYGDYPGLRLDV